MNCILQRAQVLRVALMLLIATMLQCTIKAAMLQEEYETLFSEQEGIQLEEFINETALCQTDTDEVHQQAHQCFLKVFDQAPELPESFTGQNEVVEYCEDTIDPFLFELMDCFKSCSEFVCEEEGIFYADLLFRVTHGDDLGCGITSEGVCTNPATPSRAIVVGIVVSCFCVLVVVLLGYMYLRLQAKNMDVVLKRVFPRLRAEKYTQEKEFDVNEDGEDSAAIGTLKPQGGEADHSVYELPDV